MNPSAESSQAPSQASSSERLRLAVDLLRAHRIDEGIAQLRLLLESEPENTAALGNLSFQLLKQADWAGACSMLERLGAIASRPTTPDEFYYRAWALGAMQRYGEALTACEQACKAEPSNEAYSSLGAVLALRLQRPERALELLRPLLGQYDLDAPRLPYTQLETSNPLVPLLPLWTIAAFFCRTQQAGGAAVLDRRPRREQVASRLARLALRLPLASRLSRQLLWRLWVGNAGFGEPVLGRFLPKRRKEAMDAYNQVLFAAFDVFLQYPLCSIGSFFLGAARCQDAVALYSWTYARTPAPFVHIGGYFGFSACLCALALREHGVKPSRQILAIDPYVLRLSVEHPERIFEQLARRLDLEPFLQRHTGYFNNRTPMDPQHDTAQIIGPSLMAQLGRAEAFFIDGDHSAENVACDTRLALEHLAPGGTLLYHDVLSWPSVRQGMAAYVSDPEKLEIAWPPSIDGLVLFCPEA